METPDALREGLRCFTAFRPRPPRDWVFSKDRDLKTYAFSDVETLMIANALLITVAVMLAIGFALMGELKFFIPFKMIIWKTYSTYILSYCGFLFLNVFAAALALNRKFFLKDTGRKLAHLDKQFNVGHSEVPAEISNEE